MGYAIELLGINGVRVIDVLGTESDEERRAKVLAFEKRYRDLVNSMSEGGRKAWVKERGGLRHEGSRTVTPGRSR